MKATAQAPSNIALIKYWGKRDEDLRIPTNDSVSMNLSHLTTTTTVEFSKDLPEDDINIDHMDSRLEVRRVSEHLDRVRKRSGLKHRAKVRSHNSFPAKTGLSSSASGFAALTAASAQAAGLNLSERELTQLARQGSGSACRSIPDGIVQWYAGESNENSYAESIFPADHWDIVDIVVVVSEEPKATPTTQGQRLAAKNPFFNTRLSLLKERVANIKQAIAKRDFNRFGETIEAEALELHAIMMTSAPPLIYLFPETIKLMRAVQDWREDGLPVYFTLNTGHNIHLICEGSFRDDLLTALKQLAYENIYVNKPSRGCRLISQDLF